MKITYHTMSQAINLRLNPNEFGAVAATTCTSTEAVVSLDDHRDPGPKDGPIIPAAPPPDRGLKRSPGSAWAQPNAKFSKTDSTRVQERPSKPPTAKADPSTAPKVGASTVKITGVPQYIPDSQEELLVLPPMPRSLFQELTTFPDDFDSSLTEPETSEDEVRARPGVPSK